eukprot:4572141-Amphidinium_carterae.1
MNFDLWVEAPGGTVNRNHPLERHWDAVWLKCPNAKVRSSSAMADPNDDIHSISPKNVPVSVASSSNISNTGTLPRITGMSLIHRDNEVTVASWNEQFPIYWTGVLDKATAAYSRYCSISASEKATLEANEQMGVIASDYNAFIASTNSMEVVLRQAFRDALPQGSKMLMTGIVNSDKMLLDVMRKHLPSDSFVKIGVIDSVESRLAEPHTIAECSNNLRVYLQDLRITDGSLRSLGSSGPRTSVQLNSIKVYQALRTFVSHVCTLDSTLSTKIVLLGEINESMDIDQLTS